MQTESFQTRADRIRNQYFDKSTDLGELRKNVQSLQQTITDHATAMKSMKKLIQDRDDEIARLTAAMQTMERDYNVMKQERDILVANATQIQERHVQMAEANKLLQIRLADQGRSLRALEEDITARNDELLRRRDEYQRREIISQEVQKTMDEQAVTIVSLESACRRMEETLHKKDQDYIRIHAQLQEQLNLVAGFRERTDHAVVEGNQSKAELQHLRERYAEAARLLKEQEAQTDMLRQKLRFTTEELEDIKVRVVATGYDVSREREAANRLREELHGLNAQNAHLHINSEMMKAESLRRSGERDSLTKTAEDLSQSLRLQQQNQSFGSSGMDPQDRHRIDNLEKQLREKEQQIIKYRESTASLETQVSMLKERYEEMSKQAQEKSNVDDSWGQKLTLTRQDLARKSEEIVILTNDLTASQNLVSTLRAQLKDEEGRKIELQSKVNALTEELGRTNKLFPDSYTAAGARHKESEQSDMRYKIQELEKERNMLLEDVRELAKKCEEAERSSFKMQVQFDAKQTEITLLKSQLEGNKDDATKAREYSRIKDQLVQREEELRNAKHLLQEMRNQIIDAQRALEKAEEWKLDLTKAAQEIVTLREKCVNDQNNVARMEGRLNALQGTNRSLQDQLTRLEQDNVSLHQQNERLKNRFYEEGQQRGRLAQMVDEKEKLMHMVLRQLPTSTAASPSSVEEGDYFRQRLEASERERMALGQKVEDLQTELMVRERMMKGGTPSPHTPSPLSGRTTTTTTDFSANASRFWSSI